MRWVAVLMLATACSFGGMSLDRRAEAPRFADSRCELTGRSTMGLEAMAEEQVRELVCAHESGRVRRALLIVDHLHHGSSVEDRLVADYRHTGDWGATGAATSTPALLSGVPATEHRQPFETASQRLLVLRYVQRGDSLFAAWVSGNTAEMEAREAENAAWLDAVRFADLATP